jgi:hypothetical protein
MLELTRPNDLRPEDVPTLEQLRAFQAKGPEIQRNIDRVTEEFESRAAIAPVEPTTLDRVVAVGQMKTSGGDEMTLLSLEFYNDGMIAHWWLKAQPNDSQRGFFPRMTPMALSGEDNRGNIYTGCGGGSSGGNENCHGYTQLTPALDVLATRLTIRIDEQTSTTLDGQQVIALGPDGREISRANAQSGPWEFEVAL